MCGEGDTGVNNNSCHCHINICHNFTTHTFIPRGRPLANPCLASLFQCYTVFSSDFSVSVCDCHEILERHVTPVVFVRKGCAIRICSLKGSRVLRTTLCQYATEEERDTTEAEKTGICSPLCCTSTKRTESIPTSHFIECTSFSTCSFYVGLGDLKSRCPFTHETALVVHHAFWLASAVAICDGVHQ